MKRIMAIAVMLMMVEANALAQQARKAELLSCSEKTKNCVSIAVFQDEHMCSMIVSEIDSCKQQNELSQIIIDSCCPKPSSTPALPSATPSVFEKWKIFYADVQNKLGRFYYMCRPM
jgi:hypothetical protein